MSFDPNKRNSELADVYLRFVQNVDVICDHGWDEAHEKKLLDTRTGSVFEDIDVIMKDVFSGLRDEVGFTNELIANSEQPDSTEQLNAAFRVYQDKMRMCDPIWFYEAGRDTSKVFKIHGDGLLDEIATTETEGLAVRMIGFFNNPDAPVAPLESDEIPENMFFTEGDDDDWDIYRRNNEDGEESEEWLASVSTEYLAIHVCRLISG